jgi:hypothetical protein
LLELFEDPQPKGAEQWQQSDEEGGRDPARLRSARSCLISSRRLSRSSSWICRSMSLCVSIAVSFPGSPGHSYEGASGRGTYTLRN